MKKISLSIILTILMAVSAIGCSSNATNISNSKTYNSSASQNNSSNMESSTTTNNAPQNNTSRNTKGSPDGKSRSLENADLRGEVVSVNGNNVVLKLIKIPDFSKNAPQTNRNQNQANNTQNTTSSNGSNVPSDQDNTNKPDDPGKKVQQPPNGQPPQRLIEYTGETKTITIPGNISITTLTRGADSNNKSTIALKDIKKGDLLNMWYSDKSKETISKISLSPVRNTQTGSSNNTDNNNSTGK